MAVFLLAYRGFKRNGLLCDSEDFTHLLHRHLKLICYFFCRRVSAVLMEKLAVCLFNFVDCLNHMNGNSYGSCLIGYRSCYSLTNPPCGIGGELKALSVVEFINRLYKTKVALLNQIKELHTSADITFGNTDYKTKVCFGKTLFSLLIPVGYTHCEHLLLLSGKKRNTPYFLKIHLDRIIHGKIMRIGTCCRSGILTLRQFGIKV